MRPMMPMRPPMAGFPGCPIVEMEREPGVPQWPLFWRSTLQKNKAIFQQKQGSFGFQVYYIWIMIIPCLQSNLAKWSRKSSGCWVIYDQNGYFLGCETQPTSKWKWEILFQPTIWSWLTGSTSKWIDFWRGEHVAHGIAIIWKNSCTKFTDPQRPIPFLLVGWRWWFKYLCSSQSLETSVQFTLRHMIESCYMSTTYCDTSNKNLRVYDNTNP